MKYTNNQNLIDEYKKLLIDKKISQREVAQLLGVTPQNLNKSFNKKNLSFNDIAKLLNAIDSELHFEFKDKQDLTK